MSRVKSFNKNYINDVARALLYAIIISFVLILIFALIIKLANIKDSAIMPVNVAIKTVSILFGALIGFKENKNGILKGLIFGLLYILISFLIFGLLDGGFKGAKFEIFDLIMGGVSGLISGIIAVNVKKDL